MSGGIASTMERYRAAWGRNDWEAAMAIWSDDIVHHVPGRHRLAGTFRGKQSFLDHYGSVFGELGGTIEVVEIRDVLVSGGRAVSVVVERAVRGERTLEFDRVVLYRIEGDHIVETWSYDFDPYALDEFWS